MAATAFVRARIDETLKNEAASVLADMGLTVSDVVRIVLTRIAKEKALPFALEVPNAETRAAMEEARSMSRARFANADELFHDLEEDHRH
jgi:DNA-damage-inducible protein J